MLMERWRSLDLRRRGELGPYDGELIALHGPQDLGPQREVYVVGRLEVEAGRTWMYGEAIPCRRQKCASSMTSGGFICRRTRIKEGPSRSDTVTRA